MELEDKLAEAEPAVKEYYKKKDREYDRRIDEINREHEKALKAMYESRDKALHYILDKKLER